MASTASAPQVCRQVAIVIAARNESLALPGLLKQLLDERFAPNIACVHVYDDASSDDTPRIVADYADKYPNRIRLHRQTEPRGKAALLQAALSDVVADQYIFMDADVRLGTQGALQGLIDTMSAGFDLVGSITTPLAAKNFWEHGAVFSGRLQDYVKKNVRNGDNFFACHGRLLGVGSEMAKHLRVATWPLRPLGEDGFIYLSCKDRDMRFALCHSAVVYYRAPSSISDFRMQAIRFSRDVEALRSRFAGLARECQVSPTTAALALISACVSYPVGAVPWLILALLSRILPKSDASQIWGEAQSTKVLES